MYGDFCPGVNSRAERLQDPGPSLLGPKNLRAEKGSGGLENPQEFWVWDPHVVLGHLPSTLILLPLHGPQPPPHPRPPHSPAPEAPSTAPPALHSLTLSVGAHSSSRSSPFRGPGDDKGRKYHRASWSLRNPLALPQEPRLRGSSTPSKKNTPLWSLPFSTVHLSSVSSSLRPSFLGFSEQWKVAEACHLSPRPQRAGDGVRPAQGPAGAGCWRQVWGWASRGLRLGWE